MTSSSEATARTEAAAPAFRLPPPAEGFVFDEYAAERACAFFPRYLRHTKGRWAGQPFELEPWQRQVVRELFGWKRADGSRRYRICYIEIPRKNGKTTFAAGLALYLLFADGERAAEVYSVANDTDQAMICFQEGCRMRLQAPALLERSLAHKKAMVVPSTQSAWKVLSSEVGTKDGLNASGVIFDELHALRDRTLADLMHTSVGARVQPLEIYITTAGSDRLSYCWEMHEHAERVAAGELVDTEFLPVLFGAGPEDDIGDPATWAKANPSLGRAVSLEYMAKEAERAKQLPRYENVFKRLHLNIWTEQSVRWLPMDKWDACNLRPVTLEDLRGREVWGGLDLSSTTDITALALVAKSLEGEGYDLWCRFWMPAANIAERARRDRVPYEQWKREGLLVATDGNVVDYDRIRTEITGPGGLAETAHIREIAIDRWNASQITTQLTGDGLTMVPFGQGFASMSAPSKAFEKLVLGGQLNHGGHPILRWMASNVGVEMDAAENIKPSKVKSSMRIDGIVAAIMALGRATVAQPPAPEPRIYAL